MLEVFRDSGFEATSTVGNGVVHLLISLAATSRFEDQAAARSRMAATASMKAFFEPRAVAVVGANRQRGRIGSEILHNLAAGGFRGTVVPVHPTASEIEGLTTYPRVVDIPQEVDPAIVVVPAPQVLTAVEDCIAKSVRAICVISAGFSECDAEGRRREALVLERIRTAGCRLIGPNCMGLLNTDPAVCLDATLSAVYPPAGNVAMSTQSGALGLAILDYASRLGIGISSFVSVGNKADVSSNDLIEYWAEDTRSAVILLYLESFGNPKKFSEIARRVGRTKHYRRALAIMLDDEQVDSVITIFIPALVTDPKEVAEAIAEAARGDHGKPVLGVFMRAAGAPASLAPIPSYAFPESAALALVRVTEYARWRAKPVEMPPVLDRFDGLEIRAIVDAIVGRGGGWATADEAAALLSAAGVNCASARVAGSFDETLRAASVIGYPVAIKALGRRSCTRRIVVACC